MQIGTSEKILIDELRNFKVKFQKEITSLLYGYEIAYKQFEKTKKDIPTHIRETYANLKAFQAFVGAFNVNVTSNPDGGIALFTLDWKVCGADSYHFNSNAGTVKMFVSALSRIDEEISRMEKEQKRVSSITGYIPELEKIIKEAQNVFRRNMEIYIVSDLF